MLLVNCIKHSKTIIVAEPDLLIGSQFCRPFKRLPISGFDIWVDLQLGLNRATDKWVVFPLNWPQMCFYLRSIDQVKGGFVIHYDLNDSQRTHFVNHFRRECTVTPSVPEHFGVVQYFFMAVKEPFWWSTTPALTIFKSKYTMHWGERGVGGSGKEVEGDRPHMHQTKTGHNPSSWFFGDFTPKTALFAMLVSVISTS